MKPTLWFALFSGCLLLVVLEVNTVDPIIYPIPDYKTASHTYKYAASTNEELDRLQQLQQLQQRRLAIAGDVNEPRPSEPGRRPTGGKKAFRPTYRNCCKMGNKLAKRQVECSVRVLEVVRKLGDKQRAKMKHTYGLSGRVTTKAPPITARMSTKIGKCAATFPKYLEKCCKVREQFYTSMEKCKERPRHERRECRRSVRMLYRKSSSPTDPSSRDRPEGGRVSPGGGGVVGVDLAAVNNSLGEGLGRKASQPRPRQRKT